MIFPLEIHRTAARLHNTSMQLWEKRAALIESARPGSIEDELAIYAIDEKIDAIRRRGDRFAERLRRYIDNAS